MTPGLPYINELDPRKKNEVWFNNLLREVRLAWTPLVDPQKVIDQRKVLFGLQDTEYVERLFIDAEKRNMDFKPHKHLEKYRNMLVAENENTGPAITVNAVDPTSVNQRKADKEMLTYRSDTEEILSYLGSQIGLPRYKVSQEKEISGEDKYNGNIEDFDNMGLNEFDGEDINYFFSSRYKLRHEAALDVATQAIVKHNQIIRDMPFYCNDILTCKTISSRVYVNEVNGTLDIRYLDPAKVKVMRGKKADLTDSVSIGYEDRTTIRDFINMVGDAVDLQRDYTLFLSSIQANTGYLYTGISDNSGTLLYGNVQGKVCRMSDFYKYEVSYGYAEVKTFDAKQFKFTEQNQHGNPRVFRVGLNGEAAPNSKFSRKIVYDETTYKSYYLIIGVVDQIVFRFGKLPYQHVYGSEDERSSFSICCYQGIGPSITEIAEPHIIEAEIAIKKRAYLVGKAKEDGFAIDMASLAELAQMLSTEEKAVDAMDVLKILNDSPNKPYAIGENNMGGNSIPITKWENGMSKLVVELTAIYRDELNDIREEIGLGPLSAEAVQPRVASGPYMESLQQAKQATQYINRQLMYLFSDVMTRSVFYIQSIIKFKSKNPLPYKFLEKLLGDEVIANIKSMDDCAAHRYGIYLEPFNRYYEREEIKQRTQIAFERGEIGFEEMIMVDSIDSAKQAVLTLAYYKRRAEKKAAEEVQRKYELEDANNANAHQRKLEELQVQGQLDIQAKQVEGETHAQGLIGAAQMRLQAAKLTAESNERIARMKLENEEKTGE